MIFFGGEMFFFQCQNVLFEVQVCIFEKAYLIFLAIASKLRPALAHPCKIVQNPVGKSHRKMQPPTKQFPTGPDGVLICCPQNRVFSVRRIAFFLSAGSVFFCPQNRVFAVRRIGFFLSAESLFFCPRNQCFSRPQLWLGSDVI